MENINHVETPARPGDIINGRAVRLEVLTVDELEVLHAACVRRFQRSRFELSVVQDALEERRDPEEDMGLTR